MGNVFIALARRYTDEAALNEDLPGYADKIETELKRAEERFQAALGHKGDMYDAAIGAGQVEFERAKLAANYLVKPVRWVRAVLLCSRSESHAQGLAHFVMASQPHSHACQVSPGVAAL